MIRRELAKLKYAIIIFLSCLLVILVKRDAQGWRDILKRKSLLYEDNGNLDLFKEELQELKALSNDENSTQEVEKSTEAIQQDDKNINLNQEKPYRTDSHKIFLSNFNST